MAKWEEDRRKGGAADVARKRNERLQRTRGRLIAGGEDEDRRRKAKTFKVNPTVEEEGLPLMKRQL